MPMLRLQERSKLQLLPRSSPQGNYQNARRQVYFVNDKDEKALTVTNPEALKG